METLPQGLASLPNEIIILIFDSISKITDKRHFLRTCVLYNNLTKFSMYDYEMPEFYGKLKYSMEKFTLELCHDEYFGLIPKHYITPINKILVRCLANNDNVPLPLLELAGKKGCIVYIGNKIYPSDSFQHVDLLGMDELWTCTYMAQNGHLSILKFLYENGYTIFDFVPYDFSVGNGINTIYELVYDLASKKNNAGILNWLDEISCDIDNITNDYENEMDKVD